MAKNVVVLMEGSGNAFDSAPSNVTRTLEFLELGEGLRQEQLAIWDYGVGTRIRDIENATAIGERFGGKPVPREHECSRRPALTVLDPPKCPRWMPRRVAKVAGLAIGYGLQSNVTEAAAAVAKMYEPGDRLFMFGFSRGAFTVRVLAGLLYRFGLPPCKTSLAHGWVADRLSQMQTDPDIGSIDESLRVKTTFLGLWDTVKSYGFLRPVRYFHLRHNPGIDHVRHALALDEKRSWFQCTTWGYLDRDSHQRDGTNPDKPRQVTPLRNPAQTVKEVWFRGCHSDIGGGTEERRNAEIALRWMLSEARGEGLCLNTQAESFLNQADSPAPIVPTESRRGLWRVADYIPRLEIDNDFSPAKLRRVCWPTGNRRPVELLRGGHWAIHQSVRAVSAPTERCSESADRRSPVSEAD